MGITGESARDWEMEEVAVWVTLYSVTHSSGTYCENLTIINIVVARVSLTGPSGGYAAGRKYTGRKYTAGYSSEYLLSFTVGL